MAKQLPSLELDEQLSRLARQSKTPATTEQARTATTGVIPPAWTIQIVSNANYNQYNVRQVRLQTPGTVPTVTNANELTATNLAESFTETGTLATGVYAVMWRIGNNYVFYAQP